MLLLFWRLQYICVNIYLNVTQYLHKHGLYSSLKKKKTLKSVVMAQSCHWHWGGWGWRITTSSGPPGVHSEFQTPELQSETIPRKPKTKTKEIFAIPPPNSQILFKKKEEEESFYLSLTIWEAPMPYPCSLSTHCRTARMVLIPPACSHQVYKPVVESWNCVFTHMIQMAIFFLDSHDYKQSSCEKINMYL